MVAHRVVQSETDQRGSKWGRATSVPDIDVDALFSPEPEMARWSWLLSGEKVHKDVFELVVSYCEALRLAFIVVDVLLVSYHVTRTCVSAHALWTVGLRERVTLRLADIASVRCDGRSVRASGVPAVVVPTEVPAAAVAGCDGKIQQQTVASESLTDVSVANHRDVLIQSTFPNHSATDLHHGSHSQTTSNTDNRNSLKVKISSAF